MPIFRTRIDADLTIRVYRNVPILVNELNGGSPWNGYYMRLVHLGDHAQYVRFPWQESDRDWNVPLYEAKLFSAFDHRHGTFAELSETALVDGLPRELTVMEKQNPCAVLLLATMSRIVSANLYWQVSGLRSSLVTALA